MLAEVADVSKKADCLSFAKAVSSHWNHLDVLVNNAGVYRYGHLLKDQCEKDFELMMNTNVYSAYYLTKGLISSLRKSKSPYIFNMCS